ncbi:MAG: hypothetical protein R3C58_01515 [Parvularculaceae bacterium]
MKAARFLAIVLLILAVLAGGVYLFRLPLAGWAARSALASAGFEKPAARVSALSLHGATLEGVAARAGGAEAFRFERIETDFNWRRVLAERAVETLRVGPGSVRLKLSDDGKVSLAGLPAQSGKGGALPFRSVTLSDVAFIVDAPDGGASGAVNATYDVANGGTASMTLASERLALRGVEFTAVDASGNAILSADGTIGFEATVRADMAATGAAAKDVALALKGGGSSWKDAAAGATDKLAVTARLDFSAPDIAFRQQETQPVMSADQMKMLFGEEISRAALTGALDIAFAGGAVETRIAADAPLTLTTPDGGALTVMPQGEAPFYATSPARDRASFRFTLASDGVDASGGADYENENGRWRFAAPLEIEAYDSGGLAVDRTTLLIDATSESESLINADVTVRSGVRKATIGRLAISDAPIKGAFSVAADTRARRATVMNKSGCFTLERGKGRIAEQDLETSLEGVTLCDNGAPVAIITWAGDAACSIAGVLTAKKGSLRLGKTTARGRPPALTFDATYHPAENRTVINGVIRDGAMTLNDGLDMSDVDGRFDFTLEKERARERKVSQLRVAQHRKRQYAAALCAGDGGGRRLAQKGTTRRGFPM